MRVIGQRSSSDCGAACLAMVLHARGRPTPLGELCARLGAGRDGLSALALVKSAAFYGVPSRGIAIPARAIGRLVLPVIVHWQGHHFVVVEQVGARRITIVDPARGRRRLTPEEFETGYTGVALTFGPLGPCAPGSQSSEWQPATWRRMVWPFLRRRRGLLVQLLIASVILQALGAAAPLTIKVVVEGTFDDHGSGLPLLLTLAAATLSATALLTTYLRGVLLAVLSTRVDKEMTTTLVERLLALPYGYFEQRGTGDILMRIGTATALRETLTSQLLGGLLDGGLVVCYLVVVTVADPALGLLAMLLAVAQVVPVVAAGQKVNDLTVRALLAEADCHTSLVEAVGGIATLKASGAEGRVAQRWQRRFTEQLEAIARRSRVNAATDGATTGVRTLGPVAVLLLVGQQVAAGTVSLGGGLALAALASIALAPVSSLAAGWRTLQLSRSQLDRMADILDTAAEPSPILGSAPILRGELTLTRVGYRYDPNAAWALRDIDMSVRAGDKVAIVGRSGCGKSTLVRLLVGLHPPTKGRLALDDVDTAGLTPSSWRRQLGVVLQEPSLFSGTIRDNIALCCPDAGLEEVSRAARLAAVSREIEAMPMGYDTMLAENGAGLSGGQRQRLALARALLARPAILVLDEATSHLDTSAEAEVERHLREMPITRVVIAHRLSTVHDADLIVVLDDGRIVEQGTHDQLIDAHGTYAELVAQQLCDRATA